MSATPDERVPTPERKETELRDLPEKQPTDDAAGDVKGGSSLTLEPCFRTPKIIKPNIQIDPCWRPGGIG